MSRGNFLTEPRLMTAEELSRWLGIRKQHAYELARAGVLPCVKLGRAIRFDPVELEEFLKNGGAAFAHGWRKEPLS